MPPPAVWPACRGALVAVPAGGFAHNVDISIRRLEPKLVPLQPEGSIRVGATYQIEATAAGAAASAGAPAELTPLRPLSLQLPYDPAGVPAASADSPVAVFWDGEGWVEVATTMAGAAGMVMGTVPSVHLDRRSPELEGCGHGGDQRHRRTFRR